MQAAAIKYFLFTKINISPTIICLVENQQPCVNRNVKTMFALRAVIAG